MQILSPDLRSEILRLFLGALVVGACGGILNLYFLSVGFVDFYLITSFIFRALISLCTAAVVPLPVNITASSSAALVAFRKMSRASCRNNVV